MHNFVVKCGRVLFHLRRRFDFIFPLICALLRDVRQFISSERVAAKN